MAGIFIVYEIGRYLGSYHATKRLSIAVHIMSKKVDLTFLSMIACVYETLRSFVWFTPLMCYTPCSVSNAAGVHGHIDNLLLHLGRLTGIGILQQEGATRTALLAAAIALLALTGLPMSHNMGALTVGAVQHLDDHCASPSC